MASFYSIYESSKNRPGQDYWFKPEAPDSGYEIIKKGLELRPDREDGETFWDDFITLLGQNTDEAAKLLGVPKDKIARWPGKIKKVLEMIRKENDNGEDKKKATMLPTGG